MRWVRRRPFLSFILLAGLSNVVSSAFNFAYHYFLIVHTQFSEAQGRVWAVLLWGYNLTAYPLCLVILLILLRPLVRCLADLRDRRLTSADRPRLRAARRRLLNLPLLAAGLNLLSWLPGAVVF